MGVLSNLAIIFILAVLLVVFIPMLLMPVLGILGTIFWIWMLIDCVKRRFRRDTIKVIWVLVIVFTHFIGALIYFFFVKLGSKR